MKAHPQPTDTNFVCVIGALRTPQRIAVLADPDSRLRELSTQSPYPFRCFRAFPFERAVAYHVAKVARGLLDRQRSHGMWFKVTPAEAEEAVRMAASILKNATGGLRLHQIRGARQLLGWSIREAADAAGIEPGQWTAIESGPPSFHGQRERQQALLTGPLPRVAAMRRTLESAGVIFTDGDEPGVKLRLRELGE